MSHIGDSIQVNIDRHRLEERLAEATARNLEVTRMLSVEAMKYLNCVIVLHQLYMDCMASDYNEHWESYKNAENFLKQHYDK